MLIIVKTIGTHLYYSVYFYIDLNRLIIKNLKIKTIENMKAEGLISIIHKEFLESRKKFSK